MKRYNKFDYNMAIVGILIPILLFCVSMNLTFAYFTASTTPKVSGQTTGIIKIVLTETDAKFNSNTISGETTLIPGQNINLVGTISNEGTFKCYAILEVKVNIQKSGSTNVENLSTKYYTFVDNVPISITGSKDNYSANACVIECPNANKTNTYTQNFNIEYNLNFNQFNNSYKNATITYFVKAYAIQYINIDNPEEATDLLMEMAQELNIG